jgi:hypothetical protein
MYGKWNSTEKTEMIRNERQKYYGMQHWQPYGNLCLIKTRRRVRRFKQDARCWLRQRRAGRRGLARKPQNWLRLCG